MLVKCTRVGTLFKRNNMKLGLTKPNFATANSLKEDFELDVGKSDELDKFAKKVSDKSGTEVVKQGNVVRNLGHLNQKGAEIRDEVEKYDDQVAAQVKQSISESVARLKRKYLKIVEADCKTKKTENQKFSFKRDSRVEKPVFEEVSMPRRKKIAKPKK